MKKIWSQKTTTGKEETVPPTSNTAAKMARDKTASLGLIDKDDEEKTNSSSSFQPNVIALSANNHMSVAKEEIMNGRIKAVFALAIAAALFNLTGPQVGFSDVQSFIGAIAVLGLAAAVATPQLRKNFRGTH